MDIKNLIVLACVTLKNGYFTLTHLLVLNYLLTDESGQGYDITDVATSCLMTHEQAMEILTDLTIWGLARYNRRVARRNRRFRAEEATLQLFRSMAKVESFGVSR